ncbi:MAG: ABC transporter substrate-binding protein [Lyngbya sp.]|nr:ABC transporter substrate-binding protein [Lyngbya sp.]
MCWFLAVSCTPSQTQTNTPASQTNPGRITMGTTLKIRTLDPADAYDALSNDIFYNVGDRLYTYELGTSTLIPQLATALPTVSEDGLTYKIPLRQNVVFHDGTPFNAEAMAFSLKRFIENGGQPAFLLADTVKSVEASGDDELTITLKQPFAAFPNLLAVAGTMAVSPQAYELGTGKFQPQTLVGTGPYQLAEYGVDVVRLDVFDQYWGEKPENQGVDLQRFSSPANLFNAFRSDAVDIAYLSLDPDQVNSLQAEAEKGKWQMIAADGNTVNYMVLNLNSEPLNKPEVRQALAAIVDRNLINQRVLRGQGEPLYSLIPTTFDGYKPVFKDSYGDANAEKAKALLEKAGYTPENPAVVEVWYASGNNKRATLANTLKALANEQLGGALQLELKGVEATTAFENLDKGVYPTFLLDWYADFLDADNYLQPFLDCAEGSPETGCKQGASQSQGSFYYNARVNELIDKQRQEQNPQARQAIFDELQAILAKDVPYIPLWQDKNFIFADNNISGIQPQITQQLPLWTMSKS